VCVCVCVCVWPGKPYIMGTKKAPKRLQYPKYLSLWGYFWSPWEKHHTSD